MGKETQPPETTCDVLITGGLGFIGTTVARYLLERGHRVVCLDQTLHPHRLSALEGRARCVEADICDPEAIDHWVARSGRVLHLAALVGVDEYINRPLEVLDVNILGTRNVLLACARHRRPVVFASSSETYGKNGGQLDEEADRVYGSAANNRWCYAISKSACEQYAYALAAQGLTFAACRYFNVYGAQLDRPGAGRVISKFLGCIQQGVPLVLVDGGDAVRPLCYVDDAAEATARLTLALDPQAPFRNTSINVGRDEPVTVREIAELMIELSGHQAGVVHVPGETFFGPGFEEIPRRDPSFRRLEEAIGFRAGIDLRSGMTRTLAHWGLLRRDRPSSEAAAAPRPIPEIRPSIEPDRRLIDELHLILESGQVTNGGPHMRELESLAAGFFNLGEEQVAAVSNGSVALTLVLRALGGGGKAILPSYTFIATLNAVVECGLEPIFCDIDPHTFTLSPTALDALLRSCPDARFVLAVNVFGVPPDLPAIRSISERHGALLVYDNAHGFGTEIDGVRAPREPLAQTFSLHATKLLPAGEGGLVVANDPGLIAEVRRMRNHGIAADPLRSSPGVNAKLDELRAAVGKHSLRRIADVLERRRRYGRRLRSWFAGEGLRDHFALQRIPGGVIPNFQNFGVLCSPGDGADLEAVLQAFREHGIGCRSYFNPALHHLEAYRGRFDLPATDVVWRSLVSLPMHSRMSDADLTRIETAAAAVARRLTAGGLTAPRGSLSVPTAR